VRSCPTWVQPTSCCLKMSVCTFVSLNRPVMLLSSNLNYLLFIVMQTTSFSFSFCFVSFRSSCFVSFHFLSNCEKADANLGQLWKMFFQWRTFLKAYINKYTLHWLQSNFSLPRSTQIINLKWHFWHIKKTGDIKNWKSSVLLYRTLSAGTLINFSR